MRISLKIFITKKIYRSTAVEKNETTFCVQHIFSVILTIFLDKYEYMSL
jgi:hypothetical protein